jgi:hypothetical protein
MTDNEIICALKNCGGSGECQKCPLNNLGEGISLCIPHLTQSALDLINRLKAKNKEFDEKNVIQMGAIDWQAKEINRQKAEIERLQEKIKSLYKELERTALMTAERDIKEKK